MLDILTYCNTSTWKYLIIIQV